MERVPITAELRLAYVAMFGVVMLYSFGPLRAWLFIESLSIGRYCAKSSSDAVFSRLIL